LTAGERAALLRAVLRTRSIEPHADIISAGMLSTECHIILAGFAGTYAILPDANRQIISIHIPGDFCDLHALLTGPPMDSVTALGPFTIGVVSHRALLDVALQYPRILFALWHDTLVDKAIHRAWVTNLRRDACGRLGHLLCEMRARLDLVGLRATPAASPSP
jgi:CRP-like cAMP-binding protein